MVTPQPSATQTRFFHHPYKLTDYLLRPFNITTFLNVQNYYLRLIDLVRTFRHSIHVTIIRVILIVVYGFKATSKKEKN